MRLFTLASAVCLLPSLAGCDSATDPSTASTSEGRSAIYNGSLDTAHPAVISVRLGDALCTATIVEASERGGFALTAAHCCRGRSAADVDIMAGDQATEALGLEVTSLVIDRAYDGFTHDFCLIAFDGPRDPRAALPTIPLAGRVDDLGPDEPLEFVGYGRDGDVNRNVRNRVVVSLTRVEPLVVHYDQRQGGPCNGDSGGPGLATVDGAEVIAAVVSYGVKTCGDEGVSGRVSAVLDDFLRPSMAGEPQRISCSSCVKGAASEVGGCASARAPCRDDSECLELARCRAQCTTEACHARCDRAHAAGLPEYTAVKRCVCDDACADACASDALCTAPK
jgi:hypothetical protein